MTSIIDVVSSLIKVLIVFGIYSLGEQQYWIFVLLIAQAKIRKILKKNPYSIMLIKLFAYPLLG